MYDKHLNFLTEFIFEEAIFQIAQQIGRLHNISNKHTRREHNTTHESTKTKNTSSGPHTQKNNYKLQHVAFLCLMCFQKVATIVTKHKQKIFWRNKPATKLHIRTNIKSNNTDIVDNYLAAYQHYNCS